MALTILIALAGWILLSFPVALLCGWLLGRQEVDTWR